MLHVACVCLVNVSLANSESDKIESVLSFKSRIARYDIGVDDALLRDLSNN